MTQPFHQPAQATAQTPKDSAIQDERLLEDIASYTHDPLGYVQYAFPWGEEGTELAKYQGPDDWQIEVLTYLTTRLKKYDSLTNIIQTAIRMAIAAGNGPGKSALVAWIILWAMSTMEDTKGVVTANTDTQLRTKTWSELAKWHRLCINKHWFNLTATAIYARDKEHERTWRIDQVPWSLENVEAFAGLHNKGKRVILIFDESSGIPDKIWETAEGALTDKDTEIVWLVSGNPTRNTGRFRQCFGKLRHAWKQWQIDIRKSSLVNQQEVIQWIDTYGDDSDWVRVHIKGQFPKASSLQFIPSDLAEAAAKRKISAVHYSFAPKIIGVDPAWDGGDQTVISMRQGLVAQILQCFAKNDDDSVIAGAIARHEDEQKADAVFIDQGYGTGIYSFGKTLNRQWLLVNFAGKATKQGFANKRAEIWQDAKDWMRDGGKIPDEQQVIDDFTGVEAKDNLRNVVLLESKKEMKARGLASPSKADSIVITFSHPVRRKQQVQQMAVSDYDPLSDKPPTPQPAFANSDYNLLAS